MIAAADEIAAAEGVVLGVSAPGRGVADARQALREAARAAQIAHTLRPAGGALGYGARGGGSADEYFVIESDGRVAGMLEAERFCVDLLFRFAELARNGTAASAS